MDQSHNKSESKRDQALWLAQSHYYENHNFEKTIDILENLGKYDHDFKTLTLLGYCYGKTQSGSRIIDLGRKWHQVDQSLDGNALLSLLIIDTASRKGITKNNSINVQVDLSIEESAEAFLPDEMHEILHSLKSLRLQLSMLQRYEVIKTFCKDNCGALKSSINYYKEGYAMLMEDFSISVEGDHWLSSISNRMDSQTIVNSFLVCSINSTNYYHFIAESLACYQIADEVLPDMISFTCPSKNIAQTKKGEPVRDRYHDFHYQMLSILFPNRVIERIEIPDSVKLINSYTMLSMPRMLLANASLKKLSLNMRINSTDAQNDPKIIYIKRTSGEGRDLENEDQLLEMLGKSKVSSYVLLTMEFSWQKQIEIIRHAKIIISSHGAQLTTSIFATNLEAIVEIWPQKISTPRSLCESFTNNYYWVKSSFLNDVDVDHRSSHKLSQANLNDIQDIINKTSAKDIT